MNIFQKNKMRQQINSEISETQHEAEEQQRHNQDKNNKGQIRSSLPDGVFDNVDYDGIVYYTKGPEKYNKD